MQKIKNNIPNFITCLNIVCGFGAILFVDNIELACYLIFAGAIFDFLDGFAARLLKAYSPLGKQLDSLADVITFGVAPAMIFFNLFKDVEIISIPIAVLIVIFSALRLAKFNIDEKQTVSFLGVPTPANAMFVAGLPFVMEYLKNYSDSLMIEYLFLLLSLVFAVLLVSNLPLMSLKMKHYRWNGNEIKYGLVLISVVLFAIMQFAAIPLIIIIYVILSILNNLRRNEI